jgi:hypothetical protein
VTVDEYRRIVLGMAGAVERSHMGHPDFRAPGPEGRIFATIHDTHETGSLTLTPDQQQRFLRDAPEAFFPAPGAWGRGGSTSVRFAAVAEEILGEAVTLAWQNVMSKPPRKPKTARPVRAATRKAAKPVRAKGARPRRRPVSSRRRK